MSNFAGKNDFLKSELAASLRQELQDMVDDPAYNTHLRYSVQTPDGSHFIEKHMAYMSTYLQMDPSKYISNLKLMTRVGGRTADTTKVNK